MVKKILVAYYSHSGNTEKIAKAIGKITGGTLFKIEPVQSYPTSYNDVVEQAKKEISKGYMPELKSVLENAEFYDEIYIGTPNWWGTMAPPVAKFLTDNNFNGKKILPFCTHGGGGIGHIHRDIIKLCPFSTVADCFEVYGNGGFGIEEKLERWIKKGN